MKEAIEEALSWEELTKLSPKEEDEINGPNNPYSLLRLFGQKKSDVRVTLYRDNHAWCPYCQKVWLWLEFKKVPYNVKKATMRCYGKKEDWYLKKVPSGIFPAIEIDQQILTESDQILFYLEKIFGPLGMPLEEPEITNLRNHERELFRSWCIWLCTPSLFPGQAKKREEKFKSVAKKLDRYLAQKQSPWINPTSNSLKVNIPGSIDLIFLPYLERMNASLAYYKGFMLRREFPNIHNWLSALEMHSEYRGTQGDFHTHSHDLPPQMGGCWADPNSIQESIKTRVNNGEGLGKDETTFDSPSKSESALLALKRVLKHREGIKKINPLGADFDQPLRAALSKMILTKNFIPNQGSAQGLRYLKDRVSVPRDMPLLSARFFRQALEATAMLDSNIKGHHPIPFKNRFDQNPIFFKSVDD